MKIINTWDQCVAAGGRRVVIFRQIQGDYRSLQTPSWRVGLIENGKSLVTDPKASWDDYGKKTFIIWNRADIKVKLTESIAWANEKYGVREFIRNRMGDYVEKEVNDKFPLPKKEKK